MEIRAFAERILLSSDLEEKLLPPEEPLTDDEPGESWCPDEPARPENLQFAARRTAPQMPGLPALREETKRGVAHHIMANHELQAFEVMALILVAFPDAPADFRQGIVPIMKDEQRHTRMHMERSASLGVPFGSLPVNCYIWKKALEYTCVLDYLAGLPLTFENRNLDHTLEFETAFLDTGDRKSAAVMRRIHEDEIEHVRFGIEWLRKLKPNDQSDWDAYVEHLHWPMRPEKALGNEFQHDARQLAGMDEEFIERLKGLGPED